MPRLFTTLLFCVCVAAKGVAAPADNPDAVERRPFKVFVLAGDDCVLEHAPVTGKSDDAPGTLDAVVANQSRYQSLKDGEGKYVTRTDVMLADIHPVHNNTRAPARPVRVGIQGGGGPERAVRIGPDLMLAHRLGDAFDQPVLILRYGTEHPIWFRRGSRDLGHDFRPPSSGGGVDHDGSWDVIHINHGIHDTAYRNPQNYKEKDKTQYPPCVPIDRYESNLRKIIRRLKQTGATIIWATTTPLHEDLTGWQKGDEVKYNDVARKIMEEHGVIIDDLYAESVRQGYPKRVDVHSVGNLAPKVTETIRAAIAGRETNTKPLPRVLMIGDSITGTYWAKVKENLDGEAYVCKNPANGGNSDFGLASLEEWIDLETYLLNGQEYNQLVTGVRDALRNPQHAIPDYDGRGVELAGLIWFQGMADAKSPAKSSAYEKHLANLISDLRRDLKAPALPVVVTALAPADGEMTPNQQKVFEAQMAVSDAEKYSEFKNNVISIDTRPMCRPAAESPGGRDYYKGNAESYLEIGAAMAEAMLKLVSEP